MDANQIAFLVNFDDDSEAVYIASVECPGTLAFANQTLSGHLEQLAKTSITLGPNLIVNAAGIEMRSPTIAFANGTRVQGGFRAGNTTTCP